MIKTVSVHEFREAFRQMDRHHGWTHEGLEALYYWLEDVVGEQYELDVIALCCEFTEWESLEAFQKAYGERYQARSDIADNTTFIDIDGERFITGEF